MNTNPAIKEQKVIAYTPAQQEEIDLGRAKGLNVIRYMNPAFLSVQMQEIRLGLEKELDVSYYAKPEFDWFQMEEIRLGLEEALAVEKYADPSIHYDKMRQMRLGLEYEMDLTEFLQYPAGVMKEIRKAKMSGKDILRYVKQGYDESQLQQIRIALEKQTFIDSYLNVDFYGAMIQEIRKGLEAKLDVSEYATGEYSWQQMREIRLGMESRIDYTQYLDLNYSWRQMRAVRLGLEAGLDVSSYNNLMYPAGMMNQFREELLEAQGKPANVEEQQLGVSNHIFQLSVKENGMSAYLTIFAGETQVSVHEVEEFLHGNGVIKGILPEVVRDVADGIYEQSTVLVAKGQIPRRGADGWYEYNFRTSVERKPEILPNGEADYRNMDFFESVKAGFVVAQYHEAKDGVDGFTVLGSPIFAQKGTELKVLTGKGFFLSDDNRTYTAAVDGIITLQGNELNISKEITVPEVTNATGNLSFDGTVHIQGIVGDGAFVKATGDIEIDGFVGAAKIEAGGRVIMKKGINADGRGFVKATLGVVSKYIESAEIMSEGDVETNTCLNSQISTKGKVTINKVIAGGQCYAEMGIRAAEVGNKAGIHTTLVMGMDPLVLSQKQKLTVQIRNDEQKLISLKAAFKELTDKYPPEVRNAMELYLKLERTIFELTDRLKQLYVANQKLTMEMNRNANSKIEISKTAYPGVVVDLNGHIWKASGEYNVILRKVDNQLEVANN